MIKINLKKGFSFYRESILKYGICLLVLLLPLVVFPSYLYYYVSSKTFLLYGFISVLFPLWLYTIYIDKSYRLNKKQLLFFIPLVLYILWMTLSGFFAVNPYLAFWSSFERGTGLLTLYFSFASSLIIASVIKKEGTSYIYLLFKYILISSFILSITVWLSERGFNSPIKVFQYSKGGGLLGNSSVSAAFFIFSIFSGTYLLISKSINKYWKIAVSIILVTILLSPSFINIYGLYAKHSLVEFSKGSLLGLFVGIGVILLTYLSLSNSKINRNLGIAGILISLVVFSFGWASFVTPGTYLHEKFIKVSLDTRFILWDISQKSINEHKFFGYGPENFPIAFQDNFNPKLFKDSYYNETISDRAHNLYYDTGVSGGYPAIFLYLILFVSIFYAIYVVYKKNNIKRLQASILVGLFTAYLFQNLFFFDSNITIFLLFSFIGIVYGLLDHSKKEEVLLYKWSNIDKKVIALLLIVVSCAFLFYFVILPSRKAICMQRILSYNILQDKSLVYSKLLSSVPMGNDRDLASLSDNIFREVTYKLTHSGYSEPDVPALGKEVKSFYNYLDAVSVLNNTDFRLQIALLRFNSIYYFLSQTELSNNSLSIINKAHNQSPTNIEVYWWEAQIYFWHGDNKKAIDTYKKAIDLYPALGTSHAMLLQFAKDTKDKKTYDEALIEAKNNIPDFNFE